MTEGENLANVTSTLPGQSTKQPGDVLSVYSGVTEPQNTAFYSVPGHQNSVPSSPSATPGQPNLDYWLRIAEGPDHFKNFQTIDEPSQAEWPHDDLHSMDLASESLTNELSWSAEAQSFHTGGLPELTLNTVASSFSLNDDIQNLEEEVTGVFDDNSAHSLKTNPADEIIQKLSNQLGGLQISEDLQLRCFGATSNLHILYYGPDTLSQPKFRKIRECGNAAITNAGLDWAGNQEYEELLTKLFFAWHNPLTNVVDVEGFLHAKRLYAAGKDTPLYSPCVENAM